MKMCWAGLTVSIVLLASGCGGAARSGPSRRTALPRGRERRQRGDDGQAETQRACFNLADECLQIFRGAGYIKEYGIERAARDARLGPIGGGTDEIMKEILGRTLGI